MSIYDIKVKKSDGEEYELNEYKGKPMLIVNTATKCGLSGQFDGLEKYITSLRMMDSLC